MPRKPSVTFTDKELEVMRVVWESGEATVRQIRERLPGARHYNSVLTIVRVLEQKGHLTYRVKGRAHVYSAKVRPDRARRRVLSHLINHVFGGSAVSLVLNLIDAGSLTKQDLDDIRRRLAARKGGK